MDFLLFYSAGFRSLLIVNLSKGSDKEVRGLLLIVDNSCATNRMTGRDSGEFRVQASAKLTTITTATATLPLGCSSRWSKMSFNSKLSTLIISDVDVDVDFDGHDRPSRSSPGCLPIIISKATTPKLYTSHFSVTLIVRASSACFMPITQIIN